MKDLALKYPVKIDGTDIKTLKMRRPKVRDQKAASLSADGDVAAMEIALFANLCEVTQETIEDMDMSDYRKLQEAYSGFLEPT